MEGFGPHLMLDGYGCEQEKLEDLELIYNILDEFPAQIGMTKIMPPYVFRYNGKRPENWGVSGFVLIAESHISIHTFPEKRYVSLDILSCNCFDVPLAIEYIQGCFGIEKVEKRLIERGTEFPKEISSAARLTRGERQRVSSRAANDTKPETRVQSTGATVR